MFPLFFNSMNIPASRPLLTPPLTARVFARATPAAPATSQPSLHPKSPADLLFASTPQFAVPKTGCATSRLHPPIAFPDLGSGAPPSPPQSPGSSSPQIHIRPGKPPGSSSFRPAASPTAAQRSAAPTDAVSTPPPDAMPPTTPSLRVIK